MQKKFLPQCISFELFDEFQRYLCKPAHCCLAKTRFWKPSQAQFDEPRSLSVALRCGQSSTQSCQVSRTESLSRSLALLRCDASPCPCDPPAGSIRCGQSQHRTELSCSQGKVLEKHLPQGQSGVVGLVCLAAWYEVSTPGAGELCLCWPEKKIEKEVP